MVIHLATDHTGIEHKESLKIWLLEQGYEIVDHGAGDFDSEDDYPDFISLAAKAVSEDPNSKAVVFGGSGQGEAMVANRYKGVRCAVYYGGPKDIVTLSRQHNDANMLSLGARFLTPDEVINTADLWLQTNFSNEERHVRRLSKF